MPLAKKDTETSLFVALSALTKSFWEVMMRKLFWLLALACLPTVALAQNAGPDWAYPVAPAGGPPRDANKILKVQGSDKTYNEVSANDAFGPPDWFPNEHAPMPTVVATGKKPDVRACEGRRRAPPLLLPCRGRQSSLRR